eukprot:7261617-Prymnesium_polylepis.1
MQDELVEGERRPSSTCSQLGTLLRRKELLLKRTRPITTLCELVLPAMLCALLILGVSVSTTETSPDTEYAPKSLSDAIGSLGPQSFLPLFVSNFVSGALAQSDLPPPTGIPPLGLYLGYAHYAGMLPTGKLVAPFDGTYLAVTATDPARTAEAAALIDTIVNHNA